MAKRMFDIVVCLLLLPIVVPLILLVGLLVMVRLGRPVIFRQTRPGLHGAPFDLVKFRTMSDARDADGNLLPDDARLGAFGKWLRSSSLDELPEIWNVLKGEMSLVGPRPLLTEYLPLYSADQARRHEVRPGITGWAQVNGRNAICWEDKLALDTWYVDHHSLQLDLRILMLTVFKVARAEGITQAGQATAAKFRGSKS